MKYFPNFLNIGICPSDFSLDFPLGLKSYYKSIEIKKIPKAEPSGFFIRHIKPIKTNNIRRLGLVPSSQDMALRPIQEGG